MSVQGAATRPTGLERAERGIHTRLARTMGRIEEKRGLNASLTRGAGQ